MEAFPNPPSLPTPEDILIDQPIPEETNIPEGLHQSISGEKLQSLESAATLDPLTKLLNRRAFESQLETLKKNLDDEEKYHNRELVSHKEFALLVLDIDKFKSFNDTYGHNIGDEVIKKSAEFFKKQFRATDIICRWGGEEFVILLQDVNKTEFLDRLSKRLYAENKEVHSLNFPIDVNGEEKTISFSGGLVSFIPNKDNLTEKISEADTLLYQAKETGRNQINTDEVIGGKK